jgi:hypothetical protein
MAGTWFSWLKKGKKPKRKTSKRRRSRSRSPNSRYAQGSSRNYSSGYGYSSRNYSNSISSPREPTRSAALNTYLHGTVPVNRYNLQRYRRYATANNSVFR